MTLTDVLLDSEAARKQPVSERRLNFPSIVTFPVRLSEVDDVDAFRRVISEAQRNVLAAAGRNVTHGNRVRSIKISFQLPAGHDPIASEQITQTLVGDESSMPAGNESPAMIVTALIKRRVRLPSVTAYVLQRAGGQCELCERTPFLTDSGEPYLEVHHVIQLAAGGPDTPQNTVALCPNCHHELHYGADRAQRIASVSERVRARATQDDPSDKRLEGAAAPIVAPRSGQKSLK